MNDDIRWSESDGNAHGNFVTSAYSLTCDVSVKCVDLKNHVLVWWWYLLNSSFYSVKKLLDDETETAFVDLLCGSGPIVL